MEKTQENRLSDKSEVCDNVFALNKQIRALESKYGRDPNSVSLLAVSKTKPLQKILHAKSCGQLAFGENYAQELDQKASQTQVKDLQWHFIGPIQSNKTQIIAAHADWVHSLDRIKIAKRLSAQRPESLPPIQICVQVNLNEETTKSGIFVHDLERFFDEVSAMDRLTLRGLMCIPKVTSNLSDGRRNFATLRQGLEDLNSQGYLLDTLSMGMSGDYEAAIAEGATIVRIGRAIFGQRG